MLFNMHVNSSSHDSCVFNLVDFYRMTLPLLYFTSAAPKHFPKNFCSSKQNGTVGRDEENDDDKVNIE